MSRRQLQRLAQQRLRELGLRPPLDVDLLGEKLAQQRGKPIDVVASTDLAGYRTFGFTGSHPDEPCDVIFYEARTTWIHQLMIILHEYAHMICHHAPHAVDHSYRAAYAHEARYLSPQAYAEVLGPRPPRRRWGGRRTRRAVPGFNRTLYDDPIEWEAETMATIMIAWVADSGGHSAPTPADPLEDILGDVPAW